MPRRLLQECKTAIRRAIAAAVHFYGTLRQLDEQALATLRMLLRDSRLNGSRSLERK